MATQCSSEYLLLIYGRRQSYSWSPNFILPHHTTITFFPITTKSNCRNSQNSVSDKLLIAHISQRQFHSHSLIIRKYNATVILQQLLLRLTTLFVTIYVSHNFILKAARTIRFSHFNKPNSSQ